MIELFETNLPVAAGAVVVMLLGLWLLLRGRRTKTRERHRAPDALDEGVAPAQRNRALIDAPSAVEVARGQTSAVSKQPD